MRFNEKRLQVKLTANKSALNKRLRDKLAKNSKMPSGGKITMEDREAYTARFCEELIYGDFNNGGLLAPINKEWNDEYEDFVTPAFKKEFVKIMSQLERLIDKTLDLD